MTSEPRPKFRRQQLLIDHHVQGSLLRRTGLYSIGCTVYFAVILLFTESMSRQDTTISEAIFRCLDESIYWAPGLILLTPLVAYDMLRLTNRFAGPIFRLRREMQRLVDDESESPLSFREGDYWTDFADVFNDLRQEVIELRELKIDAQRVLAEGVPSKQVREMSDEDRAAEIESALSTDADAEDFLATVGS
ncbi:hypothetical protein K227x_10120 [Rubripirellula lacrimiformis]|uniref:HAMP domain-containing protein n=1 Tax=Rubripirellula lacrimiformis TaxID=1930273 RepID=A0A517N672_9BACT|nr:hypothetical protein [Rubripirellula lacrimiformis]QDT02634.1 hypothetical protein K227x_10120 [Rubripirellula lacrimiformis]